MGTLADGPGCFPLDRGAYPPRTDCCDKVHGIRSLTRVGRREAPHSRSVLYPHELLRNASPKAISRRTSYLQVRLAFYSNPQLIPSLFNVNGFGPPRAVRHASAWPWIDHLRSRLIHATYVAHFALAFASATDLRPLTLLHRSTRRSLCKRYAVTHSREGIGLRQLVSVWFQVLFHSPYRGTFHFSLTLLFATGR